ncbi:MAG: V-type ATP synthase subunit K [Elusimicrobia bacterium]|nr:V-type ATP synthase subunit K [Elusimicrobiota bacterium]
MEIAIALLGAACAVFLAGSGSAIGVAKAGMAASGLLSEKPEKFGETFLLVVLPGTQGFYGFAVGFMTVLKLKVLTGNPVSISLAQGLQFFAACLPIAIAGLISAIHQGKVCASGIGVVAKQEGKFGLAIIYGILVETYALISFVISILIVLSLKV